MIKEEDVRHIFLNTMKANGIDLEEVKNIEIKLRQKETLYGDYILSTKPISFKVEYFNGDKEDINFKGIKKIHNVLWLYHRKIEDMGFDIHFILNCKHSNKLFRKYRWLRVWFKYLILQTKDWKWVIKNEKYF